MSNPVPAPRSARDSTKKPIPAPRKKLEVDLKPSESFSYKQGENSKTLARRVKSFSNASRQIAGDLGGIVQERIIGSTKQNVKKITRRFTTAHISNCIADLPKGSDEDISVFESIRFDSPISPSREHIYGNYSTSLWENLSKPLPSLPDHYDAPASLSLSSDNSAGSSPDIEPPIVPKPYECIFPSFGDDTEFLRKNLNEIDKPSRSSVDSSDPGGASNRSANGSSYIEENSIYNILPSGGQENGNNECDGVELRRSAYENVGILRNQPKPSKSVILQFDPLLNNYGFIGNNNQNNLSQDEEYQMLENFLQDDLYGDYSPDLTLDICSYSDSSNEDTLPLPPTRTDSLFEEHSLNTNHFKDVKTNTSWFTSGNASLPNAADKKNLFSHIKGFVKNKQKDLVVEKPIMDAQQFSHKKGMLYKVQNKLEDFIGIHSARWCILENSSLTCFSDANCDTVKEQFLADNILSIQIIQNSKLRLKQDNCDLHCFKLNVTGKYSGEHIFGTRNVSERRVWMQTLTECLTNKFSAKFTSDFSHMGWAYIREGVSGKWAGSWIILSNRVLLYAINDNVLKSIDLRKARCIVLQAFQATDSNPHTSDRGPNLLVDTSSSGFIYLRMWTSRETKTWCRSIKTSAHNNGPKLSDQQLTKNNIPVLVEKCINFIYLHGSMSKGIYRQSGVGSLVSDLLAKFREDAWSVQITNNTYSEHDVATALKRFFRDLPEPLLGTSHRQYFYQVSLLEDINEKIRMYKAGLENISIIAYNTIRKLMGHLHFISSQSSKNLMTVENLGAIWGPTLMYFEDKTNPYVKTTWGHQQDSLVVTQLIELYRSIFPEDGSQIEREKLMLQILEKHMRSPQGTVNKTAGDLRIWINYNNQDDQTFSVMVGPNKTAYEICCELSSKINMLVHDIILEEIVLDGKLTRPIHHSEKVLDIVLRWSYWDENDRKTNNIGVVKMSKYAELLDAKVTSLSEEIKYADSKSKQFKVLLFEFSHSKIICYKDKSPDVQLHSWNIEDIIWYYGHEAKRNASSRWSITFIENTGSPKRSKVSPYFGNVMIWFHPQVRNVWLGAFIKSVHTNGLQTPLIQPNLMST